MSSAVAEIGKEARRARAKAQRARELAQKEAAVTAPLPEPDLYESMRHVMSYPAHCDVTPLHKSARAWMNDDKKGFLARYAEFQKAKQSSPVKLAEEFPLDEGAEVLKDLLHQFLDNWHEECKDKTSPGPGSDLIGEPSS